MIITGFFDAYKYIWESQAIRRIKTAKGHSRKFINVAMTNDIVRLIYLFIKPDLFLITVTFIALFAMGYMFWTIYIFYPYRHRGLTGFKRPNLFIYYINSILPNSIRRRL